MPSLRSWRGGKGPMNGRYVGYVAGHDPLHDFLSTIIRDRMAVREPRPAFRVFRLSGSNVVYGYEEKFSGAKIICKFYGPRFGWDTDKAALMARREYEGLETLRRYNLVGSPHHVIRPLGFSRDINGMLALEYYSGEEFSHAITRATQHRHVWLHGDATPANFLFGCDMDVAAIDLERMRRGDRMFDVGRVAGELQHAFMSAVGDRHRAEP